MSLQLVEHGLVQRAQVRGPLVNRAVLIHVQRAVVQLQQLVHLPGSEVSSNWDGVGAARVHSPPAGLALVS